MSIFLARKYYPGDMYGGGEGVEEEPEWVISEREQFTKFRDRSMDANCMFKKSFPVLHSKYTIKIGKY